MISPISVVYFRFINENRVQDRSSVRWLRLHCKWNSETIPQDFPQNVNSPQTYPHELLVPRMFPWRFKIPQNGNKIFNLATLYFLQDFITRAFWIYQKYCFIIVVANVLKDRTLWPLLLVYVNLIYDSYCIVKQNQNEYYHLSIIIYFIKLYEST